MDLCSDLLADVCKCTVVSLSTKWLIVRGNHNSLNNQPLKLSNKKSLLLMDSGLHEVAPSSLRW